MSFTCIEYLLFLPTVVALYWMLPQRMQNLLLLAASYFFLCFVHLRFGLLIFFVTLVNYLCGLGIVRYPKKKRYFLYTALLLSLGNLCYFKYATFFLENISTLFTLIGIPFSRPVLNIILPVGISFYTFQAIAYTVDVYRGDTRPCRNPIDFALFLSFFPQLVAGPIERSRDLMPQITGTRSVSPAMIRQGLLLLLWGFFKKLVIADNTGLIAFKVFSLTDPGFCLLWSGVFAFGIQILADFWSYTDIARGSALLLGFRLSRNFNHPYFSRSPADFWRRWHITLSYWLRDYVYIPLGGSRSRSSLRRGLNIMITFLLSGLWHGASWNFLLWGGYHGMLILFERGARILSDRIVHRTGRRPPRAFRFLEIGTTFLLINIGWLFFRESSMSGILYDLQLTPWSSSSQDNLIACYLFFLTALYALPIFLHGLLAHTNLMPNLREDSTAAGITLLRPLLPALLLLGILTLRSPEPAVFIYFQF